LRAPINTHVHDIYYVLHSKGDEGFISSNREGSIALKHQYCCFDLYEHKKTVHLAIDLLVYKSENKHNIKNVFDHNKDDYNDKTIIDSTELKLYLVSDSLSGEDILIKQIPIDKRGKLLLKLEQNEKYRFIISRPGYFANGFEFSTKNMTISDTIFQPVGLHNLSKQPIVIPNIYYEYDKANLTTESTATIDTTIYKILIENPHIIAEIGSHTDARGSDDYNIVLSQKRAESVVNYLISKNIDPKRLRAKGYGETKFIAPNEKPNGSDDPEGRQRNRRTEFRIVGTIDKYSEIIYTE
jgi:peptidoglycan-associated lipoprotein